MNRIALSIGLVAVAFGATVITASCLGDTALNCLPSDPGPGCVTTACPPFDPNAADDSFVIVSEVLERRCGTLDCHGQAARPLRIYGNAGLRRPEPDLGTENCNSDKDCPGENRMCTKGLGCVDRAITDYATYYPGGGAGTTTSERIENWQSLCGLEPELTTAVYCCAGGKDRCGEGFDFDTFCAEPEQYDPETLTLIRKARLREKHKGGLVWNEGESGDVCLTNWITGVYQADIQPTACVDELQHL